MRRWIMVFASGFGTGYAPVASGTVGTLVGIPLVLALDPLRTLSAFLYLLTFVAAVAAACWVAEHAERVLDKHDSGIIVIDEIVGYFGAMLFVPVTAPNLAVAFFVFRALDVLKPYPAGAIDARMPGGAGVVLDDVVSGLYTCAVMHVLLAVGILT